MALRPGSSTCVVVTPGGSDTGRNRLDYTRGVSAQSAGAKALDPNDEESVEPYEPAPPTGP